ncbi:hypothetical protein [Hyalangium versicolor]|uniref:hypothetical protein n=1 Tax=Hyalangium versicolor TaxID=2861190 RepID=UPI001CCE6359|nr:hypothetical protein [Hyalangium versicolor]
MRRMTRQLWAAVATVVLCACGDEVEPVQVRGRVTDLEGSQGQSLGVRAFGAEGLGGTGTASAVTKVRASTVAEGGALTLVGEAEVSAQGSYTVEVPEGQQKLVLQGIDNSGTVVVSALLDASGQAGDATIAPPMDSESSLEAEVFTRIVADGAQVAQTNTVDLRTRINAKMAAAAKQGASTREAVQARVKVLAEAVRAAQEAEIRAYAKAGVTTSQSALFDAELAASAKLNVALDAASDTGAAVETAYQDFYMELAAAAQRLGAKAQQQAQAESSASVAFRATVKGRLSAQDAQPLVDAAVRAAAAAEARTSSMALSVILQASTATDASLQQADTAATALRSNVSASVTAAAAAQAFTGFSASVATGADLKSTVLGSYLGVSVVNQVAAAGAVQATATAATALDAALDVAVKAAVTATQTDTAKLATGIADAYATYVSAVKAQATPLATFGEKATPAVELLVVADGSFRLQ